MASPGGFRSVPKLAATVPAFPRTVRGVEAHFRLPERTENLFEWAGRPCPPEHVAPMYAADERVRPSSFCWPGANGRRDKDPATTPGSAVFKVRRPCIEFAPGVGLPRAPLGEHAVEVEEPESGGVRAALDVISAALDALGPELSVRGCRYPRPSRASMKRQIPASEP